MALNSLLLAVSCFTSLVQIASASNTCVAPSSQWYYFIIQEDDGSASHWSGDGSGNNPFSGTYIQAAAGSVACDTGYSCATIQFHKSGEYFDWGGKKLKAMTGCIPDAYFGSGSDTAASYGCAAAEGAVSEPVNILQDTV